MQKSVQDRLEIEHVQGRQRVKDVLLLRLRSEVFKKSSHPIGVRPPYTLKYIESLLYRDTHISSYLIDQRITDISFDDILDKAKKRSPDVIILSVSTFDVDLSMKFCWLIREQITGKDLVVIGVGQEVSARIEAPESLLKGFDIVFAGEAETEVVAFIKDLNEGISLHEVIESYYQRGHYPEIAKTSDLDRLPFPIYDLNDLSGYSFVYPLRFKKKLIWGHILSSRGCPHQCIFCSQIMRESYGEAFRRRSAGNVVDEIKSLLGAGATIITFDDDNFTTSQDHVRAVCKEIISRKLDVPWIAHSRINEVTPELLKLMKEAGCVLVRFGVESGSARVLKVLKKTGNIDAWFKRCAGIVREVKSLGMSVACLFIVGSPTETREDFRESIKFAKALDPDIIQVAYFIPFPGSKAYEMYQNRLVGVPLTQMYHYERPLINLSCMSDRELKGAQHLFYKSFLMRPGFIARHFFNYFFFYLYNPLVLKKLLGILKSMFRNR